jgi:insulysin
MFLGHLAGHEGPGSLHSYLTRKGWITSLSAGPYNLARGFAVFKVTVRLTKEGFRASPTFCSSRCVDGRILFPGSHRQVLLAMFKYLEMLRSVSLPSWFQYEMSTLSKTQFTFAEKRRPEIYAVWLSEHMLWPVPPEMFLKAPQEVEQWDVDTGLAEEEVREVLEMLRVDQARAMLIARAEDLNLVCGLKAHWELEPWYGTPYRVELFDEEFLALASTPCNSSECIADQKCLQ